MAVKLKAGILRKLWASHTLRDLVQLSKQDYKYRDKRSDHLSQDRIAEQVGQLDMLGMGTSINVFIIWKPFETHHSVKYDHSLMSNSHRTFVLKVSRMKELRQKESVVKLLGIDLWALPHQNLVF